MKWWELGLWKLLLVGLLGLLCSMLADFNTHDRRVHHEVCGPLLHPGESVDWTVRWISDVPRSGDCETWYSELSAPYLVLRTAGDFCLESYDVSARYLMSDTGGTVPAFCDGEASKSNRLDTGIRGEICTDALTINQSEDLLIRATVGGHGTGSAEISIVAEEPELYSEVVGLDRALVMGLAAIGIAAWSVLFFIRLRLGRGPRQY